MKVAIVLHAEPGTQDAMGRAAHSLIYTKELREKGHDVKLILDGGGTAWVREMSVKEHPLNPLYVEAKDAGSIEAVCKFCIEAFGGTLEDVELEGLPISGDYIDHPSIVTLMEDGYQIITL